MLNLRTVVITGASSFIGSHLVKHFAKNNWRVIAGHSRPIGEYSGIQKSRLSGLVEFAKFECIDICDGDNLQSVVDKINPYVWIQHAGYVENYGSFEYNFSKGLEINAASVPKLFNAVLDGNCGLIFSGTEAEYGIKDTPHLEDDFPHPEFPYGLTKLAGTLAAQQYSQKTGVAARVARLYLPFGEDDNPNKLIPGVVSALKMEKEIELSACTQKRDFLSIMDIANAYLKLAEDLQNDNFEILNICSGVATTLSDFIISIAHKLNSDISLLKFGSKDMRPGEAPIIVGSNLKACKNLGWSPMNIDEAIDLYLEKH
jgi:nucleoside-diphosphate-sugar epimerase